MQTLIELAPSNALVATGLAVVAAVAGRFCRRPQVVYALWLLVLVKLATPPLVRIPFSLIPASTNEQVTSPPASSSAREQSAPATVSASEPSHWDSESDMIRPPQDEPELAMSNERQAGIGVNPLVPWESTKIQVGDRSSKDDYVELPSDQLAIVAPGSLDAPDHDQFPMPWAMLLLSAWILGAVIWYSVVAVRLLRFGRQIAGPWPVDAKLQHLAIQLAPCFGLRRAPVVRLVDAVVPPMLWAMCWRAEVLLPRSLVARLSPEQQPTLLAHELAHYRRRDHLVRWFEVLVIGLYWWHPVAWIARRQLQRAEEQCCDEWVLRALPGRQCAYARLILETADFLAVDRRPPPLLATGLGPVHPLERRIEMILHDRPMHRLPAAAKWSLLLLGLLVLPISTRAQTAAEPAREPAAPTVRVETQPAADPQPVIEARLAVEAQPAVEAAAPADPVAPNIVETLDTPSALDPVVTAVRAEPSLHPTARGSVEQRLERLEKTIESIVIELKSRRIPPTASNYRAQGEYGIGRYPTQRVAQNPFNATSPMQGNIALSLSDLKKRRIDVEDHLAKLQEELAEIDGQITKMQSDRSSKRYGGEKK